MEDDRWVGSGEDDRWALRGEFDRQQDGWTISDGWGGVRIIAGLRGESLTASSVSAYRETSFKSCKFITSERNGDDAEKMKKKNTAVTSDVSIK